MRKNKLVVLSVISALAFGGATAGIVLSNSSLLQTFANVETEITDTCTPMWTSKKQPKLDEKGNGTMVNGQIETQYKSAKLDGKYHVILAKGSTMGTSGKEYDGNVGGVINGIHSIRATFDTDGQTYEVGSGWDAASYKVTKIEVKAIFPDGTTDTETAESGKIIRYDHKRPCGFEISVVADSSAPSDSYDVNKLEAKIISLEVKADMHKRHSVKVLGNKANAVEVYNVSADGKSLQGYSYNPDYYNYLPGDRIAIKAKNDGFYLKDTDIELNGASGVLTKLDKETYPVYIITIGEQDATLNVKSITEDLPYEGKDFVGSYAFFDADMSYNNRVSLVNIDAKGGIKIRDSRYKYTVDQSNVFTTKISSKTYTLGTKGTVTYLFDGNGSYMYGVKNSKATYKLGGKYLDGKAGSIVEFSTGEKVFTYYEKFFVDGIDNISITADTNDFDTAKLITLSETKPVATENSGFELSKLRTYDTSVEYTTSGETKTGKLFFKIGKDHKWDHINRGTEAGTFTGADGNLVLDGLGNFTLAENTTGTYEFDSKSNSFVYNGVKYVLNLAENTYTTVKLINSDPWTKEEGLFAIPYKNVILAFNNGTVTFKNKSAGDFISENAKYTVKDSVVTFNANYCANPDHPMLFNVNIKFELRISDDLSTLTVISAVADANTDYATIAIEKGTVLTKSAPVNPFAGAKKYRDASGAEIKFSVDKFEMLGELNYCSANSYTLENKIITISYSYDVYWMDDVATLNKNATFELSSDFSTITLTSDLLYSGAPDYEELTIHSGTVFNLVVEKA